MRKEIIDKGDGWKTSSERLETIEKELFNKVIIENVDNYKVYPLYEEGNLHYHEYYRGNKKKIDFHLVAYVYRNLEKDIKTELLDVVEEFFTLKNNIFYVENFFIEITIGGPFGISKSIDFEDEIIGIKVSGMPQIDELSQVSLNVRLYKNKTPYIECTLFWLTNYKNVFIPSFAINPLRCFGDVTEELRQFYYSITDKLKPSLEIKI